MINIILIVLFLIAPVQNTRHIQVVFIEPSGETFTQQEQQAALLNLSAALSYWHRHAPLPYTTIISSTYLITTSEDILNETNRPIHVEDLAVFIVDNSNSRAYLLQNRFVGLASDTTIWTVTSANAETYAHELGHMLYDLNHHYDQEVDIMNLVPEIAWTQDVLGCATSLDIGRPCKQIYIPFFGQ